ncbi:MAG: tyrosine-type recombinase/integrase [Planctomycetes bacterium]|nr:tyrosine-type recombinase/integrase [Planctomycetota bacterium]
MLETFFKSPGVLYRLRGGPLGAEIDGIAEDLSRAGYARDSARRYLSLVARFSWYALQAGCTDPKAIDDALVERFLGEVPTSFMRSQGRTALGHAIRRLKRRFPRDVEPAPASDPDAELLAAFDRYLRDVRGLQPRSREGILLLTRRMLAWYRQGRPGRSISKLSRKDVLAFVSHLAMACRVDGTRSESVSHVRTFLRYLRWASVLDEDLAPIVPRTPCWRLTQVPSHLEWAEVRRVIDAIDTSGPIAQRDRALLLVLATTGLRSQEVRRLELRDIGWRTGQLHIRRTKTCREHVVPLLEEPGRALADYVLHGRPRVTDPTVFLRHHPPVGPLGCSGTLSAIVRRRLVSCGIRLPRMGAHLLRHSLATRMVQQERPVKEVADLLGHRSIDTTALYVKVALPQLARVALPFPGGVA